MHVSLVSSSIRFIITCHQSPRLSISLSAPSVPLLCSHLPRPPLPFFLPPPSPRQTGLFYIACKVLGVFNSSPPLPLPPLPPLSALLCFSPEPQFNFTVRAALTHSRTRSIVQSPHTHVHAHTQKELSRVMVFSVIYCTTVVASASSIGIIIEIT